MDYCKWSCIQCHYETNYVVVLNFSVPSVRLGGNIIPLLSESQHLNYLDLNYNDFDLSTIPIFSGSLRRLKHLDLSYSNLSGPIPHHIGNLSQLQFLSLGTYQGFITCTNLDWLSRLYSLSYLDLAFVDLTEVADWLQAMS
ncbi:disease resistance family protein/LRR family protein [Forsythia ovata]|uniref:Disease resistance family protein/LRR family protein n=1 Tax=Forsythia ovata TaxID=205694 RepID=A0ABD1X264_9LAMI